MDRSKVELEICADKMLYRWITRNSIRRKLSMISSCK